MTRSPHVGVRVASLAALLAPVIALSACQHAEKTAEVEPVEAPAPAHDPAPPVPLDPVQIDADRYNLVFDAAIDQLREWQFIVDRRDRRFGVVTAKPEMASTIVEPWRPDASRSDVTWASTLNAQRRRVTVRILAPGEPAERVATQSARAPVPGDPVAPVEPAPVAAEAPQTYRLQVIAAVDRRHLPPQSLTSSFLGRARLNADSARARSVQTERGNEKPWWEPVGRDLKLEWQLTQAILDRAAAADLAQWIDKSAPVEQP